MLSNRKPCVVTTTGVVDQVVLSTNVSSGQVGQATNFTAQAYAAGRPVAGQTYTVLSNSDATKATVVMAGATGAITRLVAGSTSIVVSVGSVTSLPLVITVTPPVVATLTVTPSTKALTVGETSTLAYLGTSAFGVSVSSPSVTVEVEDTSKVTAGTPSSGSLSITAVAAGSSRVRVKSGAIVSNWSVVTVAAVIDPGGGGDPPTSITIPSSVNLQNGAPQQLSVVLRNSIGTALPLTPTWASSDPSKVSVSPTGVITWVAQGTAIITASYGNLESNHCGVTALPDVASAVPFTMTLSPISLTLKSGAPQQLSPTIKNEAGTALVLVPTSYTSTNPGVATVSPTGLVTWVAAGTTRIVAHYDTGMNLASNACVVTAVVDANTVAATVEISPSALALQSGVPQTLGFAIKNSSGTALALSPTSWTSTNTGVATVDASGVVTWVGAGTTNIVAHYSGIDSNTCTVTAVANVDTTPAIILVTPATLVLQEGSPQQLGAVVENAGGGALPLTPTSWTSTNTGVATVSSTGLVTWVAEGTTSIVAHRGGIDSNPCVVTAVATPDGGGGGTLTRPNQPAGFTQLSPTLTGDVQPPTQPELVFGSPNEMGWVRAGSGHVVTVSDSPEDSAKVLQLDFPANSGGGASPSGFMYPLSSTNPQRWPGLIREIYIRYQYWVSPNFPASLVANKMVYGQIGNLDNGNVGNKLSYLINGSSDYKLVGSTIVFAPNEGTPTNTPMYPTIQIQGLDVTVDGISDPPAIRQNWTGDPTLWKHQSRGAWHLHELYAIANTPGNSDGGVRVWFDRTLVIDALRRIKWSNNPTRDNWWTMFWDPVYNLTVPPDAVGASHRIKNLYVSGR